MSRTLVAVALTTCLSFSLTPAFAYPGSQLFTGISEGLQQIPTPSETKPLPLGPLQQPAAEIGISGLAATAPFTPTAGLIRTTYGAYGTLPIASTGVITECGPFYQLYNEVLRLTHGVTTDISCYGTFPSGNTSWVGSELIYPADISAAQPAPLIVLSPGIGVEPGMMQSHAEFYASHGYVVALGYSMANWFGYQMLLAAGTAAAASQDTSHPLYQAIDFSHSYAIGHSAGGGSALRITELLPQAMHVVGVNDFQLQATVGINPGPSDFGLGSAPSSIPTLVLVAEHESLVAHPLSRIAYDRATGEKWWAELRGAYHGTYLDDPQLNAYDATILAFLRYTAGDPTAANVFTGEFLLSQDAEWQAVERG